ncbi:DUF1778 domain-containing protein [Bosea sp. 685]|uniref:type II toxin-antitoxin system TacA family antitoxin n=1 Tax=Bosea sp. 685 TaxID=3080057 RepID=UPI002892AC61|nr:DUF1778 domain-containing protein [Bosea sp. 685]WNJ88791.1 DUF1778 domain-containing protein [Bosea sp. 685]
MPPAAVVVKRPASETKTTTINLRVPRQTRDLIDTAANVVGKTRTEFMLESAKQHAIDVLIDQKLFSLNEAQFEAFMDVLDNPPPPSSRLKRLFAEKSPWET